MARKSNFLIALENIGRALDHDQVVMVSDGGFVSPADESPFSIAAGKEYMKYEYEKNHLSNRKPGQRAAGGERAARRQRTAGRERATQQTGKASTTTPIFSTRLQDQFDEVTTAYPGTMVMPVSNGYWIRYSVGLVKGSTRTALFIAAVRVTSDLAVKAWAFWDNGEWIGPRHTNFPDGSICSFEPSDHTWTPADSLLDLLNLHCVWAVRYLYFEHFGRWPGRQIAYLSYERLTELRGDELCGCGSNRLYRDCHMDKDKRHSFLSTAVKFSIATGGATRQPPRSVVEFSNSGCSPPNIEVAFPNLQMAS